MLKPLERLAYRELLDIYYDGEKPLTTDIEQLAWRMNYETDELKQALQFVLDKFFVIKKLKGDTEPMYHHTRLDAELADYKFTNSTKNKNKNTNTTAKNTNESANDTNDFANADDLNTSDWQKRKNMVEALKNQGIKANARMKIADLQMLFDTHCKSTNATAKTTNESANDTNAICPPKNKEPITNNQEQETNNISPLTPQGEASEHEQTQTFETAPQTTNTGNAKNTAPQQPLNVSFDEFWDLYDKKQDRPKCERLWSKLKDQERLDIMAYIPKYKQAQPDKQYRKNPQTFLNNRSWENELVTATANKPQAKQSMQFGGVDDPLAVNQHWKDYPTPANWEENLAKLMAEGQNHKSGLVEI